MFSYIVGVHHYICTDFPSMYASLQILTLIDYVEILFG